MDRTSIDRLQHDRCTSHSICWQEIFFSALAGFYPSEIPLEKMFDHMERAQ